MASARGTIYDGAIIRYLLRTGGRATWGDIREAIPGGPHSDSTVKAVIDRLVKGGQLRREAVYREGKAVTVYYHPGVAPSVLINGKPFPLFPWIEDTCDRLAEIHKWEDAGMLDVLSRLDPTGRAPSGEDLKRFPLGPEEMKMWNQTYPLPGTAAALQGSALVLAMKALGAIVLSFIMNVHDTDNPVETEQYLGNATGIYLSVLVKEIAKLAHPAYGDLESEIRLARGRLLGTGVV